jgi:hypothetical protein
MKKGYSVPPCPDCGKFMKKGKASRRKLIWYCLNEKCKSGQLNRTFSVHSKLLDIINRWRPLMWTK